MRSDRAGWTAAAVLAGAYLAVGWLRFHHLWAGALDLGVFDQGAWLLSQGRAPELTVLHENLFGDHLSLVMLLFAPLYRLVATPLWLLAAQAAALGLAVLPLRAIARHVGTDPRLATAAAALSGPFLAAAVFDFHPAVLATPAVAWAVLGAIRDDVRMCTLAGLAVALMRADLAIVLLGVAVVAAPACRRRLILLVPVPVVASVVVGALLHTEQTWARYYGHIGAGPLDAALHPWRLLEALATQTALQTLFLWLLPVGFLALARPRWALALVIGGLPLILSGAFATSAPWFHHGAAMAPLAIAGALVVLGRDRPWWVRPQMLVGGAIASLLVASPLAPFAPGRVHLATMVVARSDPGYRAALTHVRPDDRVAADSVALAQLSQRTEAYVAPCPFAPWPTGEQCELEGGAAAVDVVITKAKWSDVLEAEGFTVQTMPGGTVIVGRRD
ncbi:hypothetical protein BH24ACT3_BH24ACT3_02640 [soil metagenome]